MKRKVKKPEWITQPPRGKEAKDTYAIAATYQPRFARVFLDMTKDILPKTMPKKFKSAFNRKDAKAAEKALPLFTTDQKEAPPAQIDFQDRIADSYKVVINASGEEAMNDLNKTFKTNLGFSTVTKEAAEDVDRVTIPVNPYSVKWINKRTLELVKQSLSNQQRKVVKRLLTDAFERGARAETVYQEIAENIGLIERDAIAVANRRSYLLENGYNPKQANTLTDKYRKALLGRRAELISRTETIMAQAQGRHDAWKVAQDSGELPAVERVWVSAPPSSNPNAPCDICLDLDGTTAPIGGTYKTMEGEEIDGPAAHTGCVCTEKLQRKGKPTKGFSPSDRPETKTPPTKPAFRVPKPIEV
jgi:hypothetical protein